MTILETEIWVNCGFATDKHFEDKGYNIPRYKDKKGRLKVARGTKLLVKVVDLPEGSSSAKLTKICDVCGKPSLKQPYHAILKTREETDGKDRCIKCGNAYGKKLFIENISYNRSLEFYAKENNKEYLLEEFSSKNKYTPENIFKATNDKYLWECQTCSSEYSMEVYRRTVGNNNCPFCANRRINHTNCLFATHPEIAKMLKNPQMGYELTYGLNEKVEFVCNDCGFEQNKSVYTVVCYGFSCSRCGDSIKYPEKFMRNVLEQLDVSFETQKKFDWSNNKRYDFYIRDYDLIIETHGDQHYKGNFKTAGGKTLEEEKQNDEYKFLLSIANNITNYIIIDCRKSKLDHIKNSILKSRIAETYNLDNIDWLQVHEFALNSNLVKKACELWNSGIKSTVKIGKLIKLDKTTVRKYLKQGAELGWCDYNSKKIEITIK